MIGTVPLAVVGRGFVKLNFVLLPLSLLLLVYLGTMAGASPGARAMDGVLIAGAFIFLTPAALVLAHVVLSKAIDGVFRVVPFGKPEISWLGILVSAVCVVVAGNVFLDDLYQFRNGNYGLSVVALLMDLGGMAAVVVAGRRVGPPPDPPPLRGGGL